MYPILDIALAPVTMHGEWFAPSPVVLDFIRQNAITPPEQ